MSEKKTTRRRTSKIKRHDLRYFEEHRNGEEVAFDTTMDATYSSRLGSVNILIAAGFLGRPPSRDSGFCLWYPVLRTPTEKDVWR